MANSNFITHSLGNKTIMQRPADGYLNATAMCQATGKKLSHYVANESTTAYLNALSSDTGIPASDLIQIVKGGKGQQGTWVHPHVAIHLAQWLSPEFAVKVSRWVFEWMGQGKKPDPEFVMIHKSVLDNTGKALVWMGEYGVTSQPYYGGTQPPFIDGRPAMLSDNSTRYYLSKYVGNTMEAQTLVNEDLLTCHIRSYYPTLEVVNRHPLHDKLMSMGSDLITMAGQFTNRSEIEQRFDDYLARQTAT